MAVQIESQNWNSRKKKCTSVITLKYKVLNIPIQRQGLSGWMNKQNVSLCSLRMTYLKNISIQRD